MLSRVLISSGCGTILINLWCKFAAGNFRPMAPHVEEGICQVMSHIWLTAELKKLKGARSSSNSSAAIEARLGEFYLHQISSDSSPVYGDGFRHGMAAVQQFGLERVLDHLRLTGNFPL